MSEAAALEDLLDPQPVVGSEVVYHGLVWDVRRDRVDLGTAGVVSRDVIDHPGAVGILVLDADERVALVQQYRHPIGLRDWEIPAGLTDIAGEPPLLAAQRELAEEADLVAARWNTLIDYFTSPGYTSEALRIYLAREVTDVPAGDRHTRTGEELGMEVRWVPLDDAHEAVLDGRLHNPHTVVAILSAYAARADGWSRLRAADAPWPLWERLRPS